MLSHKVACCCLVFLLIGPARCRRHLRQATENVTCPTVPPEWSPAAVCPNAVFARASFRGDTVYWGAFTSSRWGNALSPYWQARAIAILSGRGFQSVGFSKYWLQHLPKNVPASTCAQPALLAQVCSLCDQPSWEYTHKCSGAWPLIRPTIIADTHAAYKAWAAAHNHSLPTYSPGDVVIQSRCASGTVLSHPEYGPVAFSFYDHIPRETKQIYIVTEAASAHSVSRSETCKKLHDAQLRYIHQKYPKANVTVVGGTPAEDFARLLFAPILFRDTSSSFGLWAGLANKGVVWSTPMMTFSNSYNLTQGGPDLGLDWHWSTAPVLYPSVASRFNLTTGNFDDVLQWLEMH